MNLLNKAAAIVALGLAIMASTATAANATAWNTHTEWGGHMRIEVIFDNSGSETYYVRDAYDDSYGAYTTWWAGEKVGTCNDTNGAGATYTPCGPLNLVEGAAIFHNLCSRDYNGSTLVDSKCTGRIRFGSAVA